MTTAKTAITERTAITESTPVHRPYRQDKRMKTFRLPPVVIDKLAKAAAARRMSETVYVETALEALFRKDHIE